MSVFSAEIVMFEGLTCVYRSSVDLFFYVVGSSNENEVRIYDPAFCILSSIITFLQLYRGRNGSMLN